MLKIPPSYRIPISLSIFCHLILILLIVVIKPSSHIHNLPPVTVRVKTISQLDIDNQINALKEEEREKRMAEQAHALAFKKEIQKLKKQQITEKEQLAAIRAKRFLIKQKGKERRKSLTYRKGNIKEHQLVSKQKQLKEQLMEQEIEREQAQLNKARRTARYQEVLDQYKAQIVRAIQQQWIVPNVDHRLSCVLLIHLDPNGVVLSVKTLKGSGNAVLDRSARMAVFKASPLPIPKDSNLSSEFRELHLMVKPLETMN